MAERAMASASSLPGISTWAGIQSMCIEIPRVLAASI